MFINHNITLTTDRLLLRKVEEDDAQCMFDAFNYEHFTDGLLFNGPVSLDEAKKDIQQMRQRWNKDAFTFSIILNNQCVGRVGIGQRKESAAWFLMYWIHPTFQQQGIAAEAGKKVIAFGLQNARLKEIFADCHVWNIASAKTLKKIGFELIEKNKEKILFKIGHI